MSDSKRTGLWVAILLLVVVVFSVAWLRRLRRSGAEVMSQLVVTSLSFPDNGAIPAKFTCDGENISPELSFSSVPSGAKSLALIVDDPDAPRGTFVHWVLFNLPPDTHELPEGAHPQGATQGRNGFGKTGYGGPCPPPGKAHRYVFHAYALDQALDLSEGATRDQMDSAADGHILAEGTLTGLYSRGQS